MLPVVVVQRERPDVTEARHEPLPVADVLEGVSAAPAHEAVHDAPVRPDAGRHDRARLVRRLGGLVRGLRTVRERGAIRRLRVADRERDVLDPVPVLPRLARGRVILAETRRQQEADVPLREQVARGVPAPGREVRDLLDLEPEAGRVEVRRLPGVPDVEADVVDVDEPQRVRCGTARRGVVRGAGGHDLGLRARRTIPGVQRIFRSDSPGGASFYGAAPLHQPGRADAGQRSRTRPAGAERPRPGARPPAVMTRPSRGPAAAGSSMRTGPPGKRRDCRLSASNRSPAGRRGRAASRGSRRSRASRCATRSPRSARAAGRSRRRRPSPPATR